MKIIIHRNHSSKMIWKVLMMTLKKVLKNILSNLWRYSLCSFWAVSFPQFVKLTICKIQTHTKDVNIIIKNLACLLFYCIFLTSVCVLWVLWVIPLAPVCKYNARMLCDGGGISLREWMFFLCVMMGWAVKNRASLGHFILV